jgi:hypothetical protein
METHRPRLPWTREIEMAVVSFEVPDRVVDGRYASGEA